MSNPVPYLLKWFRHASFILFALAMAGLPEIRAEDARTLEFQIQAFRQITDLADFPSFKALYHFPVQQGDSSEPEDALLILRNFQIRYRELVDEDDETTYEYLTQAIYTSATDSAYSVPELGYLIIEMPDSDTYFSTGTIGFVRKTRRIATYPTVSTGGMFDGASGWMDWYPNNAIRTLEGEIHYNFNGVDEVRALDTTYGLYGVNINLGQLDFPVVDEDTDLYWIFGTSTLNYHQDGHYIGTISRSDDLEAEDLEGYIPEGTDPTALWENLYIISAYSPGDADGDQIPDIADTATSEIPFPWYADLDTGQGWYLMRWMQDWTYSDRLSTWDYLVRLGWSFAPVSGNRDSMWLVCPAISDSWLYTTTELFPYLYDFARGEFMYLAYPTGGNAWLYSISHDTWTRVTF